MPRTKSQSLKLGLKATNRSPQIIESVQVFILAESDISKPHNVHLHEVSTEFKRKWKNTKNSCLALDHVNS